MKIKLNLIPPYRKEEIEKSKTLRRILRWEMEISGILLVFLCVLLSINYILKTNLSLVSNSFGFKDENPRYVEMEKYGIEIKRVNAQISDMENIQKQQIYWSKLFLKFNELIPSDIALSNLSNKEFKVFFVGKAKTRDGLVAFKETLEKESCFSDVRLPLSNLVSRENVDFQIEFNVKEECLKTSSKEK